MQSYEIEIEQEEIEEEFDVWEDCQGCGREQNGQRCIICQYE